MAASYTVTTTGNLISQYSGAMMMCPDDYGGSSAELIKAVGGDVKFTELMRCVEAWTGGESKIDAFREMWKNQETEDKIMKYLRSSQRMFMWFVNSCPSEKHSYGRIQLCKEWAIEKLIRGGTKTDLMTLV